MFVNCTRPDSDTTATVSPMVGRNPSSLDAGPNNSMFNAFAMLDSLTILFRLIIALLTTFPILIYMPWCKMCSGPKTIRVFQTKTEISFRTFDSVIEISFWA